MLKHNTILPYSPSFIEGMFLWEKFLGWCWEEMYGGELNIQREMFQIPAGQTNKLKC